MNPDFSLLVTFHSEGVLAHLTLNSLEFCRVFALKHGISIEYILVLDSCDNETKSVIYNHPVSKLTETKIIHVANKDSGLSRNDGIKHSKGKAIAILDGDDYYSENWLERAWLYLNEYGKKTIIHPEFIVNFGSQSIYAWQMDQEGKFYDEKGLFMNNFWTSWNCSWRETYECFPYAASNPSTGFGYEDWHWNCETIANGFKHRLAWQTIGFYRKKTKHSLVDLTTANNSIITKTTLFDKKS